MPPVAVRTMKASLNRIQDIMGWREAMVNHFYMHMMTAATDERRIIRELQKGRLIDYFKEREAQFRALD